MSLKDTDALFKKFTEKNIRTFYT